MRYLALVSAVSLTLLAGLLAWRNVGESTRAPVLLALNTPSSIVLSERIALFGGFTVPEGRFDVDLRICQAGDCKRAIRLMMEGPQERWGYLGTLATERAYPPATLELRMFRADGVSDAVVAKWSRQVTVLPAPLEVE